MDRIDYLKGQKFTLVGIEDDASDYGVSRLRAEILTFEQLVNHLARQKALRWVDENDTEDKILCGEVFLLGVSDIEVLKPAIEAEATRMKEQDSNLKEYEGLARGLESIREELLIHKILLTKLKANSGLTVAGELDLMCSIDNLKAEHECGQARLGELSGQLHIQMITRSYLKGQKPTELEQPL